MSESTHDITGRQVILLLKAGQNRLPWWKKWHICPACRNKIKEKIERIKRWFR
tara:strand:- start:198 stop:356 length:159 start_codon:yes stop_codon:yes gene_type:complete